MGPMCAANHFVGDSGWGNPMVVARTYVYELRTFGKPMDGATLTELERAACDLDYRW